MEKEDQIRLLEALIFAAPTPVTTPMMQQRLPGIEDFAPLLAELKTAYENRGVNLIELNGAWTFRTASDLAPYLKLEQQVPRRLSRAALETLAIIAYHQPVTRGEIEEIRGVAISRGTLDLLMEIGWIKPKGHKPVPGRPATWVTTDEFLDHFQINNLKDLPGMEELKAMGLLDRQPIAGFLNQDAANDQDDEDDASSDDEGELLGHHYDEESDEDIEDALSPYLEGEGEGEDDADDEMASEFADDIEDTVAEDEGADDDGAEEGRAASS